MTPVRRVLSLVAALILALLPFLAGGEFVQASSAPAGFDALAQGASVIALGTVLGSASQWNAGHCPECEAIYTVSEKANDGAE